MKNLMRIFIFLAMAGLLVACARFQARFTPAATGLNAPTTSPTSGRLPPKTEVAATVYADWTQRAAGTATPSATSLPPTSQDTPRPSPTAPRWWMPTLEPTGIPDALRSSLSVQARDAFNGHNLKWVAGWERGVMNISWMDANHLIIYPVTGMTTTASKPGNAALIGWTRSSTEKFIPVSRPVVINLGSSKVWVPFDYMREFYGHELRMLPVWSSQLGALVAYQSEDSIGVYRPDGDLIASYQGTLVSVSPSGARLLLSDGNWIDLSTQRKVHFDWPQLSEFYKPETAIDFSPIWSTDETRVYMCCYFYGDARAGKDSTPENNRITIDGEEPPDGFLGVNNLAGTWMLGDKYMLSQWGGMFDRNPGFVPLFDPAARTYRNLNKLANIPVDDNYPGEPNCTRSYAMPGGRYVWLECTLSDYLVDLATFESKAFPAYAISAVSWSADGKYAWINGREANSGEFIQVLSTGQRQLTQMGGLTLISSPVWHTKDDILAYLTSDGLTLSILDAGGMYTQKEASLPAAIQQIVWSPDGKHLALLARDSSLWEIDYPNLDQLEQLTAAKPEWSHQAYQRNYPESLIENLSWSPDGASLAFVGGGDVYIVNTRKP